MKKSLRIFAAVATAAIGLSSMFVFAGCDTNEPEITITYSFNGKDYEVGYTLNRAGAPQTVRHFIELADAGYYENTVIHDYQTNGTFLYGGGYVLDDDGELVEKDYWSEVERLEKEKNMTFTQSVFREGTDEGLYTVYGEFKDNGVQNSARVYNHTQGALVMYYMDKGDDNTTVRTVRADNGEKQDGSQYRYNSATSLFYTFTGSGSRSDLDSKYCVFGKTKDYSEMSELLDAISEYASGLDANVSFAEERRTILNQHDPFELVKNAKITADYQVPTVAIVIKSVEVTKY